MLRLLPPIVAVALLAGACGGSDDTLVEGSVEVDRGGTVTGLVFDEPTRLVDDRVADGDGVVAGHCALAQGSTGEPHRVNVAVQRTGIPTEDLGLHAFEVSLQVAGPDVSGMIVADVGGERFEAEGDATSTCRADVFYLDMGERVVGVDVSCSLVGPGGATADTSAELHFSGCVRTRAD
jgi:hypothetical protein